jgi:hypothetical protein
MIQDCLKRLIPQRKGLVAREVPQSLRMFQVKNKKYQILKNIEIEVKTQLGN